MYTFFNSRTFAPEKSYQDYLLTLHYLKMRKNFIYLLAAVLSLPLFTSCSNDDDNNGGINFSEQTYDAWSKVVFAYGTMFDAGETLTVSKTAVAFHSDTWGDGTFSVNEFTQNQDGSYSIQATGSLTIAGHSASAEAKSYDATVTGTIAANAQTFTISLPSVMGGTTLLVTVGEMPLAAAVDGTYTGGTYADAAYFDKFKPTKGEKAVIKANDALDAATLTYTSETWGEFTFEAISITKNTDGSYTLAGEGKTLMPGMNGESKEYAATLNGTISNKTLVATFAVPSVMGGTTVYFNAADFDEVYNAANPE